MSKKLVIKDKYKGILFIIMAGFFFSLMTFFVRISGDLPTMQKAFFRNAVAAVVAIAMLMRTEEKFRIRKDSWRNSRTYLQFLCHRQIEYCRCKYPK